MDVDPGLVDQTLTDLNAIPGWGQVDLLPAKLNFHRAQNFLGCFRHQLLGDRHNGVVISISHIKLKLGEFRIMLERNTFVAEIAPDLVNAVQPAHQETFQIKLEADAQKQFLMQLIVVGRERSRCRAAIDRLQNWCFNFHKVTLVQKSTDRLDRLGSDPEDLAYFGVHSQVNISAAIAGFRIGKLGVTHDFAVHGFVLIGRKGQKCLRKHPEILNLQCHFAALRAHHLPAGFDEVAQIVKAHEFVQFLCADLVHAHQKLDLSGAVFDMSEAELAHMANRAQSTSQNHLNRLLAAFCFSFFKKGDRAGVGMALVRAQGVRFLPDRA